MRFGSVCHVRSDIIVPVRGGCDCPCAPARSVACNADVNPTETVADLAFDRIRLRLADDYLHAAV